MKTLFKILAILIVAILVGSLFYTAVTTVSSASTSSQTAIGERPLPPDGEFRPEGEEEGSLQFPAEALKSLAIISAVGALYLNIPKWIKSRRQSTRLAS